MPNWCNNQLTVSNHDQAKMEWLRQGINGKEFFNHIKPVPAGLEYNAHEMTEEVRNAFVAQYGVNSGYDWRNMYWGTKWDVEPTIAHERIDDSGSYMEVVFDTAWGPPEGIYRTLVEMGFIIYAEYFEPGMCFGGWFTTENNGLVNVNSDSIHDKNDEVRQVINDTFGIDGFYDQGDEDEEGEE